MEIVEVQNALSRMEELSPKLADIISAVEEGYYTQNEIAEYLRKSPATVRTQLGSIYKTTGIKSVTQLAIVVYYRTLVNSGDPWPAPEKTLSQLLTPRELQVAYAAAKGKSSLEIAAALDISKETVTSHLSNIFNALGFSNRTELALRVMREQLFSPVLN